MMKGVLAGVGAIGLLLGASGVQAQTCTLNNWSSSVGATNLKVGTVADGNRRYAGPCGLNVALNGAEAYLEDTTPVDETEFNVRFYFFLNNVTSDVTFYQALDGTDAVITAKYDASENAVDVVLGTAPIWSLPVSSGWNSLEIQWESSATATPKAILTSAAGPTVGTLSAWDTSAFVVDSARLGAIDALVATMPSAGSIDFDDYDSRRDTVPGTLLVADVNGDGVRRGGDITALINNLLGTAEAAGQPDCNQDGRVTGGDITCLINLLLAD